MPAATLYEDDEKQSRREDKNGGCDGRLVFFLLGLFIAVSIGLAIALGVTLTASDNDNDRPLVQVFNGDTQAGLKAAQSGVGTSNGVTSKPNDVTTTTRKPPSTSDAEVCVTPSCVLRAGELIASIDNHTDPCEDFYQFACGKWVKTHSIPDGTSRYGRFDQIIEKVELELKGLLEEPYHTEESQSIRKLKNYYQSCVNEERLTTLGVGPLQRLVQDLGTWPLTSSGSQGSFPLDLEALLVKLALIEVAPIVEVGVSADNENSSLNIIWIDQPRLGMDGDYFMKGSNSTEVTTYQELLRQLALHVLKVKESASLSSDIRDVVNFEVELAKIMLSKTESRNIDKYYKKMTVAELQTAVPNLNWMKFLSGFLQPANLTITKDDEVALVAEAYLNAMTKLYQKTDKRVVANYLLMQTVLEYYSALNKEIRDLYAPLRKVLYGISQSRARWHTCVYSMSKAMPTAVGQLYVSNYFSPKAKEKALEMVHYLRNAEEQMIRDVSWMDDATKDKALEKAEAIIEKIAYPDYQFNDTVLEEMYDGVDYKKADYFQNILDQSRQAQKKNSLQLLRVPNRQDWSDAASTVNAFYSDSKNTITFPAGILQPPFYSEDLPMSMIFGGIGMVIGHEMTHGFDDQGRKYDENGNSAPWWSATSVQQYQKLAKCYVDQYGQNVVSGEHLNGNLTLGENIADNGGIKAAFMAYKTWRSNNPKEPLLPGLGLSHEQLFFLNFAQGWCGLITEEAARDRVHTDPHSPGSVRVQETVSNSRDFAEAYKCRAGAAMNPSKKCHLW